jgi:hypothetical protein
VIFRVDGLAVGVFLCYITDSRSKAIGHERSPKVTREERRVEQLTGKLAQIGPMLPGSISEQWNVCGTPGCRCKDPDKPVKHGPYYQLSFTVGGRSSTMFIKKENLPEARRRLKRYQEFKTLCSDLVHAYVTLARKTGFERSSS